MSRAGHTPSFNTTIASLRRLGWQDAARLREIARNLVMAVFLRFDNVQKYLKQRERRIGRENEMKVGLAATAAVVFEYDVAGTDLDAKLNLLRSFHRDTLTVEKFLSLIDTDHYAAVAALHWLSALVSYIPQLAHLKSKVAELFKTTGSKLRVPKHKTELYPLASVAKNENVMPELRDALVDFLEQLGQTEGDYVRRFIRIGGDGLTYERMLQLKRYLADQKTEFQRFDIVQPFVELWHMEWMYLSATYQKHFADLLTSDPSKLGHSAAKIGQKAPTDLKKVDYYPATYLSYLVLDVRMLDCWRCVLTMICASC